LWEVVGVPALDVVSFEEHGVIHQPLEGIVECNAVFEQHVEVMNSLRWLPAKQKIPLQILLRHLLAKKQMVAAGPPCSARIDAAVRSSSAFSRHVSNVVTS
jgi:hypothetical protein